MADGINTKYPKLAAATTYQRIWHKDTEDDQIHPIDAAAANMGIEKNTEIDSAIAQILSEALSAGIYKENAER